MDTIVTVIKRKTSSSWLMFKRNLRSFIGLKKGAGCSIRGKERRISWEWIKVANGARYYSNWHYSHFIEAHGLYSWSTGKTSYNPKDWCGDWSAPVFALRIGRLYWRLNMQHEFNQRTNMYGDSVTSAGSRLMKLPVPFISLYYRRKESK